MSKSAYRGSFSGEDFFRFSRMNSATKTMNRYSSGMDPEFYVAQIDKDRANKLDRLKARLESNKTLPDYLGKAAVGAASVAQYGVELPIRGARFMARGAFGLANLVSNFIVGIAPSLVGAYVANLQLRAQQANNQGTGNVGGNQGPASNTGTNYPSGMPPIPPQAGGQTPHYGSTPAAGSASAYVSGGSNYTTPQAQAPPPAPAQPAPVVSATATTGATTINNTLPQPVPLAPAPAPASETAQPNTPRATNPRPKRNKIMGKDGTSIVLPDPKYDYLMRLSAEYDLANPPESVPESNLEKKLDETGKTKSGGLSAKTESNQPKVKVSIPLMITARMRKSLYAMNYTEADVDKMRPEDAYRILHPEIKK